MGLLKTGCTQQGLPARRRLILDYRLDAGDYCLDAGEGRATFDEPVDRVVDEETRPPPPGREASLRHSTARTSPRQRTRD